MKKVSVVILIAVFGLLGWALPAGAEKIRLTDDQMDSVAAGGSNCVSCLVDEHLGGSIGILGGGFRVRVLCDDGKAVNLTGGGGFHPMTEALTTQSIGGGFGGGGFLTVTPGNSPSSIVQMGGGFHFSM